MPANELVADGIDRVGDRELAALLGDLGQKDRLEQKVAQLLAKLRGAAAVNGLEDLVGFLEHERTQRRLRLLAIPRTAVRGSQRSHDLDQAVETIARPHFASGSGRTWNFTSLLIVPLPPSTWNGARVA